MVAMRVFVGVLVAVFPKLTCGETTPATAPTPSPTKACATWCDNAKHSWKNWTTVVEQRTPKCEWKNCQGCPECEKMPNQNTASTGRCASWCDNQKNSWKGWTTVVKQKTPKCEWKNCQQCPDWLAVCPAPTEAPTSAPTSDEWPQIFEQGFYCATTSFFSGFSGGLEGCKDKCEEQSRCNYFSYHATDDWCMTHGTCTEKTPRNDSTDVYNIYKMPGTTDDDAAPRRLQHGDATPVIV